MHWFACIFALCAVCAPAAAAQLRCNPMANQSEMNDCARRNFQGADAQLNIVYGQVMEGVSGDKRVALRKEQHAWLAQRDSSCKSEVRKSEGGSTWTIEFYSCLEASTKRRTDKVRGWIAKQ